MSAINTIYSLQFHRVIGNEKGLLYHLIFKMLKRLRNHRKKLVRHHLGEDVERLVHNRRIGIKRGVIQRVGDPMRDHLQV